MKKAIRITALLTVICICFSMSGCMALDKLRASRAIMGPEDTIVLQDGTVYKLLPECKELSPDMGNVETIYIVDEEVPLLFVFFLGIVTEKSEDGRFLSKYSGMKNEYYCRSDIYYSVFQRIYSSFTPELYCYRYYDPKSFSDKLYTLTPEQAAVVERVYTTQAPEKLPSSARLEYDYRIDLIMCSSDYLFATDTVDICELNGMYYLFYDNTIYSVPEELNPVFDEIVAKKAVE